MFQRVSWATVLHLASKWHDPLNIAEKESELCVKLISYLLLSERAVKGAVKVKGVEVVIVRSNDLR
jgi:hypothetical protein